MAFRHDLHAGVFAALAAWLHFEKAQTGVAYHPLTVFQPPAVSDLHLQGHETVYFLDYTGPTGFPEAVAAALATGKVIVLDHHKTAADSLLGRTDLPANMVLDVDMSRSGATIARDWFRAAIPKVRRSSSKVLCWIWGASGITIAHSSVVLRRHFECALLNHAACLQCMCYLLDCTILGTHRISGSTIAHASAPPFRACAPRQCNRPPY